MRLQKISLLFLLFILSACATYAPQYKNTNHSVSFPTNKEIVTQFYLIGDAGKSPMGGMSPGLTAAKANIGIENSKNDFAIYLGDNIYPDGMPQKGNGERKYAENHLDGQLKTVQEFKGTTYFIPGNHDWYNNGLKGLSREQEYLIKASGNTEIFQPKNGCPIKSIAVNDDIQIIIIDTQWYLEDWNKDPDTNKFCEVKSREKFFIEIELEIRKNRDKTILFAMHHPMFTNGTHGGYYGLKKHLYPFQNKVPMPLLASLITQVRTQGGVSVQDRFNELYNILMNRLGEIAKKHPRLVFASGHEHSLHHIEKEGLIQIQSGSASKESAGTLGETGEFSYGGHGYAIMTVFKDGATWVRYYGVTDSKNPKLLFQKEIFPPKVKFNSKDIPYSYNTEKTAAIYTRDSITELSFLNTVWGAHFEKVYATPVKAKVAKLDSLFGGVSVINEQSTADYKALRIEDASGNTYRMRSLGKNSFKYKIQKTKKLENTLDEVENQIEILDPSLRDISFFKASHPYAVLALPKLAKEAGVFHTTPKLYYVPKQPRLGRYNDNFGDALYMISLEPNKNSVGDHTFNYPDDIETTDDILIKLRKSGTVGVDEKNYISSRLFDMLIGDWDREQDRWRWAEYNNKDSLNVFVPIPKDRDDAFSNYEGNILDVASSIFSNTSQRHVYSDDLIDLAWFNKEGIIFDRALLHTSGRNQWRYVAQEIQEAITDTVIEAAFNEIPQEVQEETLADLKAKLKGRRDNLLKIADRYYTLLSSVQIIEATDKKDAIDITRLANGKTNVKIYQVMQGSPEKLLVERLFNSNDTRELWIYGLDKNDTFTIKNKFAEPDNQGKYVFIRLIGGYGNDTYNIQDGNRVKVYDHKTLKNTIINKESANIRLTDIYNFNTYDYRKQVSKSSDFDAALSYTPDAGFIPKVQYAFKKIGFQRNPFSYKHLFNGAYYTDTESFDFKYSGEYANIKGDRNINYSLYITSPNFIENYFGYGNETTNKEKDNGYSFNRVNIQKIKASVGLLKNSAFGSFFKTQLSINSYKVGTLQDFSLPTGSSFITDKTSYFSSLDGIYSYRSFDNANNPSRGMLFDINPRVTTNLNDLNRTFGYLKTRLGFYNSLVSNNKLVLKTNVKGNFNFGNKFEFYQGVTLGGDTGLRAYREERFTGKSALVCNADLRYSFNPFRVGLIPMQLGVYSGADLGRVWIPTRQSKKWHTSYGAGLWLSGSGGLNGNFSAFTSSESTRITFGLGFKF